MISKPVAQSRLNILKIICSGNKQYFAQIIFQFQVIIIKSIVLFRIQELPAKQKKDRRENQFPLYQFHPVSLPG